MVAISKFEPLLFWEVTVLFDSLELCFPNHFVIPASDLTSKRSIIFEEKNHFLVLRLLTGLAVIEARHSLNDISRTCLASCECLRCVVGDVVYRFIFAHTFVCHSRPTFVCSVYHHLFRLVLLLPVLFLPSRTKITGLFCLMLLSLFGKRGSRCFMMKSGPSWRRWFFSMEWRTELSVETMSVVYCRLTVLFAASWVNSHKTVDICL